MSTTNTGTGTTHTSKDRRDRSDQHAIDETKPSFKTTELIAYLAAVAGVLIASAMVNGGDDGEGDFSAQSAWLYITILTVGYMVARGLAKSGSYSRDDDRR